MQIHEITCRNKQLNEGLLDNIKDKIAAAGGAVVKGINTTTDKALAGVDKYDQFKNTVGQKIDTSKEKSSVFQTGKSIVGAIGGATEKLRAKEREQEQAKRDKFLAAETQKYVKTLATEWPAVAQQIQQQIASVAPKPETTPATTSQSTTSATTQTTNQNKPSQQDIIAAQNKQMSPASGIKEAKARQRRVQARKNKTQSPGAPQQQEPKSPQDIVLKGFTDWANKKLTTQVGNQTFTLDDIIDANPALNDFLDTIVAQHNDVKTQTTTVQEFLLKAVQQMQKMAKEYRATNPEQSADDQEQPTVSNRPAEGQLLLLDPAKNNGYKFFKMPNGKWYQDSSASAEEFNATHPVNRVGSANLEQQALSGKLIDVKPTVTGGNKYVLKNKRIR
jgi:hypothetical protein